MVEIYWGCLIGGILFTLLAVVAGDLFDSDGIADTIEFDGADVLNPTTIITTITVFGGSGVLLSRYTSLDDAPVIAFSVALAMVMSVAVHFLYIRPMKRSESSLGFSITELVGRTARVTIPIPAKGFGEVMVTTGGGNTCQIAASHDHEPIPAGTEVVVVEVRDTTTLSVTPFNR